MDRHEPGASPWAFRVLGPMEIVAGGRPLPLRAPKQRILLAALLLEAGSTVAAEHLVGHMWDGDLPASARSALQVHMTRLRRTLETRAGAQLIHTAPEGYRIDLPPDVLDLEHFDRAVRRADQARTRQDRLAEVTSLAAARSLWRGPALVDVPSDGLHRDAVPALTERLLQVCERYFEVSLMLGRHERVLPELRAMTTEHPYRERFWCQLMLGLYRCDRRADALAVFREVNGRLNEELGIDPGERLLRLHQAILAGTVERTARPEGVADALVVAGTPSPGASGQWVAQCQLPPDDPNVVGREELLSRVVRTVARDRTTAPPVVLLSGGPGSGKTATVVRAAHRLRHLFPDGQWYLRLRTADGATRDTSAVLAELLAATGEQRTPDGPQERAAALRARLADRRVLIVLDDVREAETVVALLPGNPACAVLAAGGVELPELSARCDAHRFPLEALSGPDAQWLLRRVVGTSRVAVEPTAADEIVALCGGSPLALRIAATRLADRPDLTLSRFAASLRGPERLSALAVGHGQAPVRAAFDAVYRALEPPVGRLFRLLSLVPAPDFTVETARALVGSADEAADQRVERLLAVHLVVPTAQGRLRLPELLRLYAAERSRAEDPEPDRSAAWERLRAWYTATAESAATARCPDLVRLPATCREPCAGGGAYGTTRPRQFADEASATAWLDSERAMLVALAEAAVAPGGTTLAWALPDLLRDYLWSGNHHEDARRAYRAGQQAAIRLGDRRAEAVMRIGLGLAEVGLRRPRRAHRHFTRALEGLSGPPDHRYRIMALHGEGLALHGENRAAEATRVLERALELAVGTAAQYAVGSVRRSLAAALHDLGRLAEAEHQLLLAQRGDRRLGLIHTQAETAWRLALLHADRGRPGQARTLLLSSLELAEASAPRDRVAAMTALARVERELGHVGEARDWAERALTLAVEAGDPLQQAEALIQLGEAGRRAGRAAEAVRHQARSLRLARECGSGAVECAAHTGLALAYGEQGQPSRALRQAAIALHLCGGDLVIERSRALRATAVAQHRLGRHADAARSEQSADALCRALGLAGADRASSVPPPRPARTMPSARSGTVARVA